LRLKNKSSNRNISAVDTMDWESEQGDTDSTSAQQSTRTIKQLKAKMAKLQAKIKVKAATTSRSSQRHSKWKKPSIQASKWNNKKPANYLPADEWNALTDDQRKAARDEREKKGIHQRKVSAIRTSKVASLKAGSDKVSSGKDGSDDDSEMEDVTPSTQRRKLQQVAIGIAPGVGNSLLFAPAPKDIVTSRRGILYAKSKKDAETNNVSWAQQAAQNIVAEAKAQRRKQTRKVKALTTRLSKASI